MQDLVIVAERADGGVDIITPSEWVLHRLQRNHPEYDRASGAEALRRSNTNEEVAETGRAVDLKWETTKMQRRGEDPNSPRNAAYLAYQTISNAGTCTYEESVAAIALKDCIGHVNYRIVPRSAIPTDRTYRNYLRPDLTYDTARIVADLKVSLKKQIDDDAERERMRDLTPGTGMAATYAEKRDQANAVHSMGKDAANALSEAERIAQFPTLAASVGIDAPTLWECSQIVIAKSEAQTDRTYAVERTRLSARKTISTLNDIESLKAAYEAITCK